MKKVEIERKRDLARTLYLSGLTMDEISDKVGISRTTLSKWSSADGWQEARAAKNITRPELVNKLLLSIDNLITTVNDSNDPALIGSLADKLSKLSAVVEKLDKKANVVDAVEVFIAFNRWLQYNSTFDPEITPELIKTINKYQDKFLREKMSPSADL